MPCRAPRSPLLTPPKWVGRASAFAVLTLAAIPAARAQVPPATISAPASKAESARGPTAADVGFVQGMIGHHGQALDMTALVSARTRQPDITMLGERITVSQRDEMAMMSEWLRVRGEPTMSAAHHGEHLMPGMLAPAQMDSLRAAQGAAFDRLFLRFMIQHHEGALLMVKDLLATPQAAQDPQLFTFVADVDTDQRAEIRRMQALLDSLVTSVPARRP